MSLSHDIAEKSVEASVAAIGIYNKPDFRFREEAFSLLMVSSWELLLKAKWLFDHKDQLDSLWEYHSDGSGPRLNRCKNPVTHSITYLSAKLLEDANSGLAKPVHDNILALIEIRDNSAHFINKDINFGKRVLEIGTAALQNYLWLSREWFQLDLSRYNFYLMPLSFYHGFEAITTSSVTPQNEQVQRLLDFMESLESQMDDSSPSLGNVSLRLETRLVRAKDAQSIPFRFTDDPKAPTLTLSEEDVLRNYPLTYKELTNALHRRYQHFLANQNYHAIRRPLETNKKYCITRLLHPTNPKSSRQRFYNTNIFQEFDKHYERRTKG